MSSIYYLPVDKDVLDFFNISKRDQLLLIEIAKKLKERNISIEELKRYLENIDYKITIEDKITQLERRIKAIEEKVLGRSLTTQEAQILDLAKSIGIEEAISILENELKVGEKLPEDAINFLRDLLNMMGIKSIIRVERSKYSSKIELVRAQIKAGDLTAYEKYRIYEIKIDWGTEPGYKLLLAHINKMLIKQHYIELKKLGVVCDYVDAWWKHDKPHKKVKGGISNLLLAKARTINELRKKMKEIISKIYEINQIIPPATEWRPEELYAYLDRCKRSNRYTYMFFKILAFQEKPLAKEQLIKEMRQQFQVQITPMHLMGIRTGIIITSDKLNKKLPIEYSKEIYQIRDEYRSIIQQYFALK